MERSVTGPACSGLCHRYGCMRAVRSIPLPGSALCSESQTRDILEGMLAGQDGWRIRAAGHMHKPMMAKS